jgi:hypothetical protein
MGAATVSRTTPLTFDMREGGGFVARLAAPGS